MPWIISDGELIEVEDDGGFGGEPPLPPPAQPPQAVVTAMAELVIIGDEITGFETAAGIGFGMALGPGIYWLFFPEAQPDALYVPIVQAPGYNADITAREVDFFEVTVSDRTTGEPTIPARLLVTVQRVK